MGREGQARIVPLQDFSFSFFLPAINCLNLEKEPVAPWKVLASVTLWLWI